MFDRSEMISISVECDFFEKSATSVFKKCAHLHPDHINKSKVDNTIHQEKSFKNQCIFSSFLKYFNMSRMNDYTQ